MEASETMLLVLSAGFGVKFVTSSCQIALGNSDSGDSEDDGNDTIAQVFGD